jgi:hypothetical protein
MENEYRRIESVELDYSKEYREYSKCWKLLWLPWFLAIPLEVVVGVPLCQLFNSDVPAVAIFVIVAIAFLFGGHRLSGWRCPRCNNSFHGTMHYFNMTTRKCLNCGLSLRSRVVRPSQAARKSGQK